MRAREVAVSVADFGNSLYVNITLKLPGTLEHEEIPGGKRVIEGARNRKNRALQKFIESIVFPEE